jgi:hypothetical protein
MGTSSACKLRWLLSRPSSPSLSTTSLPVALSDCGSAPASLSTPVLVLLLRPAWSAWSRLRSWFPKLSWGAMDWSWADATASIPPTPCSTSCTKTSSAQLWRSRSLDSIICCWVCCVSRFIKWLRWSTGFSAAGFCPHAACLCCKGTVRECTSW